MFFRFVLPFALALTTQSYGGAAIAENKENIESGTQKYRLVRYTRDGGAQTCTAMVCERRNSQRCGVEDGLFTISKRTEDDYVYVSYYPADREASRRLKTRIQIGSFRSRSFYPVKGYTDTWIVPNITENADMLHEMERADRQGPIKILTKTESFPNKAMLVRDFDGMKSDVRRLCPQKNLGG